MLRGSLTLIVIAYSAVAMATAAVVCTMAWAGYCGMLPSLLVDDKGSTACQ